MDNVGNSQYLKELAEGLASGQMRFDGLFVSGDVMAAEFIQYASSLGIRIPEDVQVVKEKETPSSVVLPVSLIRRGSTSWESQS